MHYLIQCFSQLCRFSLQNFLQTVHHHKPGLFFLLSPQSLKPELTRLCGTCHRYRRSTTPTQPGSPSRILLVEHPGTGNWVTDKSASALEIQAIPGLKGGVGVVQESSEEFTIYINPADSRKGSAFFPRIMDGNWTNFSRDFFFSL